LLVPRAIMGLVSILSELFP